MTMLKLILKMIGIETYTMTVEELKETLGEDYKEYI